MNPLHPSSKRSLPSCTLSAGGPATTLAQSEVEPHVQVDETSSFSVRLPRIAAPFVFCYQSKRGLPPHRSLMTICHLVYCEGSHSHSSEQFFDCQRLQGTRNLIPVNNHCTPLTANAFRLRETQAVFHIIPLHRRFDEAHVRFRIY